MKLKKMIFLLSGIMLLTLLVSCAPDNEMYLAKPAGFWAGLWHGMICMITFVISLFTDKVGVYEVNNNGGWYDFGFILGIGASVGHGYFRNRKKKKSSYKGRCGNFYRAESSPGNSSKNSAASSAGGERPQTGETQMDADWEEIGRKVEEKVKASIQKWLNETEKGEMNWGEIAGEVEEKIKRECKNRGEGPGSETREKDKE